MFPWKAEQAFEGDVRTRVHCVTNATYDVFQKADGTRPNVSLQHFNHGYLA